MPAPLGGGLLTNGGGPGVSLESLFQGALNYMKGQNEHNATTTNALRDHQETLEDHGTQLAGNKVSITDLRASLTSLTTSNITQKSTLDSHTGLISANTKDIDANTKDIAAYKLISDANKDDVTLLKTTQTEMDKRLKSEKADVDARLTGLKTSMDNYSDLNAMVMSKNDTELLTLTTKLAAQEVTLVDHDVMMDNLIEAVNIVGNKTDKQDMEIASNREQSRKNTRAINGMRLDNAVDRLETDERLCALQETAKLQNDLNDTIAAGLEDAGTKIQVVFQELAQKVTQGNAAILLEKYNEKEMEDKMNKATREVFQKRRRLRGKRRTTGSDFQAAVTVDKLVIGRAYKKTKLGDDAGFKFVGVAAAAVASKKANETYPLAKLTADERLKNATAELDKHLLNVERRQEEAQEWHAEASIEEQDDPPQEQDEADLQQQGDPLQQQDEAVLQQQDDIPPEQQDDVPPQQHQQQEEAALQLQVQQDTNNNDGDATDEEDQSYLPTFAIVSPQN